MYTAMLSVLSGYIFSNSFPHIIFTAFLLVGWSMYTGKKKNESYRFIDKKVFHLGFSISVTLKLKSYLLFKYTVTLEAWCCKAYCFQIECWLLQNQVTCYEANYFWCYGYTYVNFEGLVNLRWNWWTVWILKPPYVCILRLNEDWVLEAL